MQTPFQGIVGVVQRTPATFNPFFIAQEILLAFSAACFARSICMVLQEEICHRGVDRPVEAVLMHRNPFVAPLPQADLECVGNCEDRLRCFPLRLSERRREQGCRLGLPDRILIAQESNLR